jgi:Rrf2 family transcriptional regulator, iron-sulfur cluster assembly transcription factor
MFQNMTVIFSKKCELALQAVLFLSAQQEGTAFNASDISDKLGVSKEFTAKVLQTLVADGMVGSKKGKNGGFYLKRSPERIRLIDIVLAIDGLDIFHKCVLGFKGCNLEEPCPVHSKWGKLREETYKMLSEESLAELRDKTIKKIDKLT